MIQNDFIISFYLDERRKKANGLFPVKLNVYNSLTKKNKYYPTKFEFSAKDYQSVWKTTKTRSEFTEVRLEMMAVESSANEVAKTITPFSFEQFKRKLYRKVGDGTNVFYYYDLLIRKNNELNSIGTATMYELSKKSLLNYLLFTGKKSVEYLMFNEINVLWLERYEHYMVYHLKRSRTTLSMYLRCLRAVFNYAIGEKEISVELYPFGRKKYVVPTGRNVKKALNADELKILFEAETNTIEQSKARDFWFFSYVCNGMNIKDIAALKWKHFETDKLVIPRTKTIRTSNHALPIIAYLNVFSLSIIDKYGNKNRENENYIFPILNNEMNEIEKYYKVKNFTRFINQNFKKFAHNVGVKKDISTYWARHSFATQSIRKGAHMEFVSEALNHNNLKTTKGYFAGFEDETKREFSKKIMEF